jgi:hypothetical protein
MSEADLFPRHRPEDLLGGLNVVERKNGNRSTNRVLKTA